ncbi:beta-lactamase family protein [Virgibacillus sp. NKC19-16]|uniref:serine hydrolase domain-containing protein n=1 Tax=Virgibacillus salidurans TaxID=2831673 RepID=UPI001F2BAF1F|nr:serine hydrolase domain-containing protein [Virgibacillus sp. NKC19-16]UJL46103.1 beta-lactamase family protein [Virgibacillus sp. NKC19-16]
MNNNGAINKIRKIQDSIQFSGTFYAKSMEHILTGSYGFANRSEKIKNQTNTRYAIASGCKIFTSVAICQLVEKGKISFDTKVKNCLDIDFPHFDEGVTIHHLLTHTSGIPDYFDEDEMNDYEELWVSTPMYHIRMLHDFLPLFENRKMKADVGSSFHYNNAGYIVLGLIVEHVSGLAFSDYIEQFIFQKAGMADSGYFEMDELPERVALGYIEKPNGGWKTNVYSLPAKPASDGGAYVTAKDMITFWDALMNHQLLTEEMTRTLLRSRAEVIEDIFNGYGGYMETNQNGVVKYILMGYDPGVNFRAVHYPDIYLTIVVCSNESEGAYDMIKGIENAIL